MSLETNGRLATHGISWLVESTQLRAYMTEENATFERALHSRYLPVPLQDKQGSRLYTAEDGAIARAPLLVACTSDESVSRVSLKRQNAFALSPHATKHSRRYSDGAKTWQQSASEGS